MACISFISKGNFEEDIFVKITRILNTILDTTKCPACLKDDVITCVSLPCGHVTTCYNCRETVRECVQCNRHIDRTLTWFDLFHQENVI